MTPVYFSTKFNHSNTYHPDDIIAYTQTDTDNLISVSHKLDAILESGCKFNLYTHGGLMFLDCNGLMKTDFNRVITKGDVRPQSS